ncbi:MAG TPA: PAS domain S-box protein, partial [Methanocella sp.]|nr:PAS domain S-box protein [Methanocella sp.]
RIQKSRLNNEEAPPRYEVKIQTKSGNIKWIYLSAGRIEYNGTPAVIATIVDITDRKIAEQALKEREANLVRAEQIASLGYWEVDMTNRTTHWSDGHYAIFGLKPGEGKADLNLILSAVHPEDKEKVKQVINSELFKGNPLNADYRIIWPDGTLHHMHTETDPPIVDSSGRLLQLFGISQDITSQKLAEQALRDSEHKFRVLTDTSTAGIYVYQGDQFIYANNTASDISGYTKEELLQMRFIDIVHPEHKMIVKNIRDARMRGESPPGRYEIKIVTKSGEIKWVYLSVGLINYQGKPAGIATVIDITERKLIESALKDSEEKFRSFVEQTASGITIVDLGGKLIDMNRAAEKILGIKKADIIGRVIEEETLERLLPPVPTTDMKQILSGLFDTTNNVKQYDYSIDDCTLLDGSSISLQISMFPIMTANGKMIGSIITDVTERKRIEKALEWERLELKRSNQDLERFAYLASHDLQEPLRTISSYLTLLNKRYRDKLDSNGVEYLNYTVEGAEHMRQMIKDLLEYSRVGISDTPIERTDLQKILDHAKKNLYAAIKESKATITQTPLPIVTADSAQIYQVIQNLLSNSIKYRSDRPPEVRVTAERKGNEWVISVSDNGIGIDPQYFGRLFVVFQRLHSRAEYPGNGLGLALCKKIVERHSGRIWVESEQGKGSTFRFTLPAND